MTRFLTLLALFTACTSPGGDYPPIRIFGERVQFESRDNLDGPAAATWAPVGPTVYLHPSVYDLSSPVRWWIIGHELCHLAHPESDEMSADCCGLLWVVSSFGFSVSDLADIVSEVQTWPASEVHPGGTMRALGLLKCAEGML